MLYEFLGFRHGAGGGLRSSGAWRHVTGWSVPEVAIERGGLAKGLSRRVLDILVFEDDVTTVSRNVGPHIPCKKETVRNRNINVNSSVVLSELSQQ
jgi:hypothetical protein